jgi:hypothetical protein
MIDLLSSSASATITELIIDDASAYFLMANLLKLCLSVIIKWMNSFSPHNAYDNTFHAMQNLKLIINDKRPENAQKTDPGMPSTHSNGQITLHVEKCKTPKTVFYLLHV